MNNKHIKNQIIFDNLARKVKQVLVDNAFEIVDQTNHNKIQNHIDSVVDNHKTSYGEYEIILILYDFDNIHPIELNELISNWLTENDLPENTHLILHCQPLCDKLVIRRNCQWKLQSIEESPSKFNVYLCGDEVTRF